MTRPQPLFANGATRLLLATSNQGKLEELRFELERRGLPVALLCPGDLGIDEAPDETGETFCANARLKAGYYAELASIAALADDSGLEVDALNGAPGVLSARYGGSPEGGIERLLRELAGVEDQRRTARFRCAMALAVPGEGIVAESEGAVEGWIARERRGEGGFGYDPVFIVAADPARRHMAELAKEEKQAVSHRGKALTMIIPAVAGLIG